ncbi:hypothetical protein [Lapidilactobacillus luobeiensis]|uniref:hypothetical protein n=1 Tax=Lapidilactobacillus luobeiensis TaxID=2950371 RepID=UPI0021C3007B|nr:hypothetical protein [Lapidilactobacillus luobeiensis]
MRLVAVLRVGVFCFGFLGVLCEFNRLGLLDWIFRVIAGFGGFGWDATASGRLSWLERGGHCFEPIRKPSGLSQNQALF